MLKMLSKRSNQTIVNSYLMFENMLHNAIVLANMQITYLQMISHFIHIL